MQVSKLIGAIVGLGFGSMSMGAAVAGEPPTFSREDIRSLSELGLQTFQETETAYLGATRRFISAINAEGELFVLRGVIAEVGSGRSATRMSSVSQANCDTMMIQSLGSRLTVPGQPVSIRGAGEWVAMAADSVLAISCNQARGDRASAGR